MAPLLTILGLGPGDPGQRTREAEAALSAASRVVLRTGIHPGLDDLLADPRVTTCDDLYERGGSFDEVYAAVVERVLSRAAEGELVYAVPGHPLAGERTVSAVLAGANAAGIATHVIPGVSALDAITAALGHDLMADEVQVLDGAELARFVDRDPFNGSLPDISPTRPAIVGQVYASHVASAVKVALSRLFPDDHPVTLVTAAGVPAEQRVDGCRLYELDRRPVNHLTSLWVPALPQLDATRAAQTVHRIASRLRAADGCPWDRKQTHASLRGAVIEEAYEVADAIDAGEPGHLAEELGDLLLQVAMHAQIADEAGDFSIGDVFDHVNRKLVRRHPHVFGHVRADDPDAVVRTWEAIKASERGDDSERAGDPFDHLPRAMPASTKVARLACAGDVADAASAGLADELGRSLLEIVEAMGRAGLEPERELERAYRARTGLPRSTGVAGSEQG